MAAQYTCLSCQVIFANAQLQRSHYKCDWHRYNLKRKVAALPPVTAEEFQRRVLALSASETTPDCSYCQECGKQFATRKSYDNHAKSKKHQEAVLKFHARDHGPEAAKSPPLSTDGKINGDEGSDDDGDDSDWESVDEEQDRIPPNCCLFCDHQSTNCESNVEHMTTAHSFFIPDAEYLVDLEGLLTYLGYKVGVGKACLWCRHQRSYGTLRAVQQHMADRGHCKMDQDGIDGLMEYADFYDYSPSYPDPSTDPDEEVDVPVLEGDGWQLVLPSGAVVGHRSLARYYRQNLPAEAASRNRESAKKLLSHYRALGWTGCTSREDASRKAKDIRYMRALQAKQAVQLSVKANKFQKHFRQQVLF
ncbi:ribosome biogenesis protein, putative [Ixodes scapularis]|uniref:Ribosome biogenesis protein, putative n=1 Tax=Ixodes scapularis TaxID=6945 RepID=B7QL67_IXOSC|nr:ribosome biogenesis protein, putative [Ixodes scapularis]|eukprot:XP_002415922.1 ribosome biogenesis protein, putative [Ixodes scapularis]